MASYFDEHNCEPLNDQNAPDHFLQMARYVDLCDLPANDGGLSLFKN